jgi:hypothetical protein
MHDRDAQQTTNPHTSETSADSAPFMSGDKIVLLLSMITYGIGQTVLFIVFPPLVEQIGLSLTQFGLIWAASNLIIAMWAI